MSHTSKALQFASIGSAVGEPHPSATKTKRLQPLLGGDLRIAALEIRTYPDLPTNLRNIYSVPGPSKPIVMTAARSPMSQHNPVEVSTSSAPTWMLDWKWHEFKVFETMHMSYMNRQ